MEDINQINESDFTHWLNKILTKISESNGITTEQKDQLYNRLIKIQTSLLFTLLEKDNDNR